MALTPYEPGTTGIRLSSRPSHSAHTLLSAAVVTFTTNALAKVEMMKLLSVALVAAMVTK